MSEQPAIHLVAPSATTRLEDLADDDLMRLARTGRADAFGALVTRHQSLVLGSATRYLGDRTWARDVTQDVFLALWAEKKRYRPRGRFRSYLLSMTFHRCHHVMRQRKSRGQKLAQLAEAPPATVTDENVPLDVLVEHERAQEVREAVTQLPTQCREIMILRFTHDLPLNEISELTGVPLGTVKSHIYRGLKRLHGLLPKDSQ